MIYLDTSLLAAIFFREANAVELVARIERMRQQRLMISAWTLTEMASVGGIKERTGVVDAVTRRTALATFQRFVSAKLGLVEIEPGDFRTAAVLIDTPVVLRAGDALHLAVIRRLNARLASLDRRLCEATDRLGIGRVELA